MVKWQGYVAYLAIDLCALLQIAKSSVGICHTSLLSLDSFFLALQHSAKVEKEFGLEARVEVAVGACCGDVRGMHGSGGIFCGSNSGEKQLSSQPRLPPFASSPPSSEALSRIPGE